MNRIKVPITLALPAVGPVAVKYQTRDGTAKAGQDYYESYGFVLFHKGETVQHVLIQTVKAESSGEFYLDLYDPVNGVIGKPDSTITIIASESTADLTATVRSLLDNNFAFIRRATGATIAVDGMPELITSDGLVRNNQFVGGALGGYTPDGTASSEGIALLMRGVIRAYTASRNPAQLEYFKFLMDAACRVFFRDQRPTANAGAPWWHSWIANAGQTFNVRGPIPADGDLALTGYIGGRDPESSVVFADGVGMLVPAPEVAYQVVTSDSEFVWDNVFADLVKGLAVEVDYYINTKGNRVHGTQKGGSFGQPIDEVSGETPGKIVLKEKLNGTYFVNYCVTVPTTAIAYGELYEAWPMWRKMYANEISTAADALHWFYDAFAMAVQAEPTNLEWVYARDRMLDAWRTCCMQESNTTTIFQAGTDGPYNNFPLSYSFGYGRDNIDEPDSIWNVVPPTTKYTAVRTEDGYVTFTMPEEDALPGSGESIRYGMAFENSPLYLTYTPQTKMSLDMLSGEKMVVSATMTNKAGEQYSASILVPAEKKELQIGLQTFMQFQNQPGDGTGDKTGDWTSSGEYVPPEYSAVPFPGRITALIGDSITNQNTLYNPPKNTRFAYHSFGMAGFWTYACALSNHRLTMEPGVLPDINGNKSGYNFGIAGSKVANWWLEKDDTFGDGKLNMGPMWAATTAKNAFHCCHILGGTNDLAANTTAAKLLNLIKKSAYEMAIAGKWVFVQTIMPRTTDLLTGYTLGQQDLIRDRILDVNKGLREWIAEKKPPNIWLVDTYDLLVGPNGYDPAGLQSDRSDPDGKSVPGNYRADAPGAIFMADGLHPSPPGALVSGKELARVMVAAGVPDRPADTIGTIGLGANRVANPSLTSTTTRQLKKSNMMGRARGLGPARTDATHAAEPDDSFQNTGLGYEHGPVPDYWFIYRASNEDAESYSNFNNYAWADLAGDYPELQPYREESTWADGAAKTEIVTIDGKKGIKVTFDVPQTGNKNEAFVVRTYVPKGQHGLWDDYSWGLPQSNPQYGEIIRPNFEYSPGQFIAGEAEMRFSNIKNLHTFRMAMNFLSINTKAVNAGDGVTSGAVISGFSMGQNFWPPSLIDKVRMHPMPENLLMRTPLCRVPLPAAGEDQQYVSMNFEMSVDASTGPASVTVIILNPKIQIVSI